MAEPEIAPGSLGPWLDSIVAGNRPAKAVLEVAAHAALASSLGVLGTQLKTLPPVVPQAMENVHTLSSIIADRRDQLGSLLSTTQTVTNTLRSQQANIGAMVNQGQQLVGDFVTRRAAFHAMMQSLTKLMTTLDDTVIGNRPQVEKLLADLDTLTGMPSTVIRLSSKMPAALLNCAV